MSRLKGLNEMDDPPAPYRPRFALAPHQPVSWLVFKVSFAFFLLSPIAMALAVAVWFGLGFALALLIPGMPEALDEIRNQYTSGA